MKTATPALISHLAANDQFLMADLYSFALLDGTALRYTDAARDLAWGGAAWLGSSVQIERQRIKSAVGLSVDELEIDVYPRPADQVDGVAFLQAGTQGRLDGAGVTLQRLFMQPFGTGVGAVTLFVGRVSDVSFGRSRAVLKVRSLMELLNVQMPRRLYQPGCGHALFDAGCGLAKSSWGAAGAVSAVGDPRSLMTTLAQPDGYFALGTITMISGANNGLSRTVLSHSRSGGTLQLAMAFPKPPAPGDGFTAWPGCDKQFATCTDKFANPARFSGFPHVPAAETAY